ncbi:MAG: SIS domain-containing protein [Candidatus Gastranaerophilales bacterium]|nr:SIS domain-containing protein [Candidatus Gastranaerophilales bacterium]
MKNLFNIRINKNKEYLMLKETLEQEKVFKDLVSKYFDTDFNITTKDFPLKKWDKIVICASGSSKNAGEIVRYVIEDLAQTTCVVEYASEYAHRKSNLGAKDLFIAISQSGNTADTFEALNRAKETGACTFAITNDENSKIHKTAHYSVIADAGIEKSIAATKSFTAQLFILFVFAIALAEQNTKNNLTDLKRDFCALGDLYKEVFDQRKKIKKIAKTLKKSKSIVVLSRNINSALAKEGGLKIKETCYINAISASSGEFLHGHFAFLDRTVPIIAICNKPTDTQENYDLLLNNIYQIKTKRKTNTIIIKTRNDCFIEERLKNKFSIEIPPVIEIFTPFLNLIALQLIAYETAKLIHTDIDKPRNLTKCVDNE